MWCVIPDCLCFYASSPLTSVLISDDVGEKARPASLATGDGVGGRSSVDGAGNPRVVALSFHTIGDELNLVLSFVGSSQHRPVQQVASEDGLARRRREERLTS